MTDQLKTLVFESECPGNPVESRWSKEDYKTLNSCVMVAITGSGMDPYALLGYCGPHVEATVNALSEADLEVDRWEGFDDLACGIWVWEGIIRGVRYETLDGTEYDEVTEGIWRDPTDREWEALRARLPIWDPETLPKR